MSNIEKIRQEIERRKKICEGIFERESDTYYQGKAVAYGEALAFIDSLPEEKLSYVTDSPGDPGPQGEPGISDLEVAAREIVIKMHPCLEDCTILGDRLTRGQLMALVKAGAEWQKGHLTVEDIKTILDLSFWNNDPQKILEEYNRLCDTSKVTRR